MTVICEMCNKEVEETVMTAENKEICEECANDLVICDHCNQVTIKKQYIDTDVEVCYTCFEDYIMCDHCNNYRHIDKIILTDDEVELCEDCSSFATICDSCNDIIYSNRTSEEGETLCGDCGYHCPECGALYIHEENACLCCAQDLQLILEDYNAKFYKIKHLFTTRDMNKKKYPRTFGIEIERENVSQNDIEEVKNDYGEYVICKHDGSLSDAGAEFCFQPVSLDKVHEGFFDDFKYAIQNTETDFNTGIHIHVGKRFISMTTFHKLLYFINQSDTLAVDLFNRKPHENYAKTNMLRKSPYINTKENTKKYEMIVDRGKTIEFRMFKSLKRDFTTYFEVVDSIISFCESNNSLNIMYNDTYKKYLNYVLENKKIYKALSRKIKNIYDKEL